jgi:hypothetical protein
MNMVGVKHQKSGLGLRALFDPFSGFDKQHLTK